MADERITKIAKRVIANTNHQNARKVYNIFSNSWDWYGITHKELMNEVRELDPEANVGLIDQLIRDGEERP